MTSNSSDIREYPAVKQKVLIFCDWYEPGYKAGGPIRSCSNIVAALHQRYTFYIITSDRDLGDAEAYPGIEVCTWSKQGPGLFIWYSAPGTLSKHMIRSLIMEIGPDTVYFNSMFSARFTLLPLWVLKGIGSTSRIVLAPRGMLHKGAIMQKKWKKKVFLQLFRLAGMSRKIIFHATDEQERNDINSFFSGAPIMVVENIPSVDPYRWESVEKIKDSLRMVFVSRIHPKKNLHFLLQLLADKKPEMQILLDVFGEPDHQAYFQKCQRMASSLPSNVVVNFMGPLPHHQLFPTLRKYHLFVLPTLGENFGHAVIEALSSGRPVLISDQTPWRALENHKAGFDLPLADTDSFKKSIDLFLKMDQQQFDEWSSGAHAFAAGFIAGLDYSTKYTSLFK